MKKYLFCLLGILSVTTSVYAEHINARINNDTDNDITLTPDFSEYVPAPLGNGDNGRLSGTWYMAENLSNASFIRPFPLTIPAHSTRYLHLMNTSQDLNEHGISFCEGECSTSYHAIYIYNSMVDAGLKAGYSQFKLVQPAGAAPGHIRLMPANSPNNMLQVGPDQVDVWKYNFDVKLFPSTIIPKGGIPKGSYQDTCRNISYDGTTLKAQCKADDGTWKTADTPFPIVPTCPAFHTLSNHDGSLWCDK